MAWSDKNDYSRVSPYDTALKAAGKDWKHRASHGYSMSEIRESGEITANLQRQRDEYISNARTLDGKAKKDNGLYSTDSKVRVGQQVGRDRFKQYYGQEAGQTGGDVQNIKGKLKGRMEGSDPRSGQQQNAMNRSLRRMKSRGASNQQVESASRTNALNYSAGEFKREGTAINDYRRLIGNFINGGQNLEMGFANLEKSGDIIQQPNYSSSGWSVICTELHRQGIMSDELYAKDQEYGRYIWDNHIHMFIGYLSWARSVVKLMRKSTLFTKIIAIPTMAWARNIGGEKNILGGILKTVGEPLCDKIGKLVIWRKRWNIVKEN